MDFDQMHYLNNIYLKLCCIQQTLPLSLTVHKK